MVETFGKRSVLKAAAILVIFPGMLVASPALLCERQVIWLVMPALVAGIHVFFLGASRRWPGQARP